MPVYEYQCPQCLVVVERNRAISARRNKLLCPDCRKRMEIVPSRPARPVIDQGGRDRDISDIHGQTDGIVRFEGGDEAGWGQGRTAARRFHA